MKIKVYGASDDLIGIRESDGVQVVDGDDTGYGMDEFPYRPGRWVVTASNGFPVMFVRPFFGRWGWDFEIELPDEPFASTVRWEDD
ncbi:MAG: hypothetical protein AAGA99_00540 [Actinomycetota bacterium]